MTIPTPDQIPKENTSYEPDAEALMREMLKEQLVLDENLTSTSQLLRFVLSLTHQNLTVINMQLEKIQKLSNAIDKSNCTS